MPPEEREELIRENERNFIEGYSGPQSPFKYLSKEEIARTHHQIDLRMQQLQDSGLTREELLFDQQVRKTS
jgi:hypothetical protein